MLVYRKNPEGIKTFLVQQICIVDDYVSENDLYLVFLTLVHLSFVFLTLASDFYGEQAGSCIQQSDDNMERNDHGTKCPDGIVKWFYALQRSLTVNSVFLKQVQISLTQKVPLTC